MMPIIAHIDMNSYFASVEQQANPFLRGRAVGVCAYAHEYGCVIAASVEAKKLGMKVGMTVHEARKIVPGAVFVQNDPAKYRVVTSRIFALFDQITDRVEHYSIDEAFLDLTGWYRDEAEAAWALTKVRRKIRDEIGDWLRCSIGIAPTRFLAKTASDMEKPNGLVIINEHNLDEVLGRLDLEDVCGIGRKIRRRLERLGIHSLLELKSYPVENLIRAFGINGLFLSYKVRGIEFERVQTNDDAPKSIGHSYCVPDRVNKEGRVVSVLTKLTERAGRRLRKLDLLAGTVSVMVGFRTGPDTKPSGPFWQPAIASGGGDYIHLGEPVSDSMTLVSTACDLLRDVWENQSVNFLAVTLSDLSEPTAQARLDDSVSSWDRRGDRRVSVSRAIDAIRDRYGDESVVLGSMFGTHEEAPDRIGFRKVDGVECSQ